MFLIKAKVNGGFISPAFEPKRNMPCAARVSDGHGSFIWSRAKVVQLFRDTEARATVSLIDYGGTEVGFLNLNISTATPPLIFSI
jgi:hypothetical protein